MYISFLIFRCALYLNCNVSTTGSFSDLPLENVFETYFSYYINLLFIYFFFCIQMFFVLELLGRTRCAHPQLYRTGCRRNNMTYEIATELVPESVLLNDMSRIYQKLKIYVYI